jgi:hypothetical protein
MNTVVSAIGRLAEGKPPTSVVIGSKYTGRHEVSMDSRTGQYSESLPPPTHDSFVLQQALTAQTLATRRKPDEVRQK